MLFSHLLSFLNAPFHLNPSFDFCPPDLVMHTDRLKEGGSFLARAGKNCSLESGIQKGLDQKASLIMYADQCWSLKQHPTGCWILTWPYAHLSIFQIIDFFYPEKPPHRIAVTGTNGKTSVVHYLSQCWQILEHPWSIIGTLGYKSARGSGCFPQNTPDLTTPDRLRLAQLFQKAVLGDQSTHLAMEVSSHSLLQDRIEGLSFQWGIWTSFSQDHLDYHGSMDAYWQAKSRLLSHLTQGLLVHEDVTDWMTLREKAPNLSVHSYGQKSPDLFYKVLSIHPGGRQVLLSVFQQTWEGFLPFVSNFQCDNLLAALGIIALTGENLKNIFPHLSSFSTPPGRMEHVGTTAKGSSIYVDYAHTPDALEQSLKALRQHTKNRVGVVFGCGGERDASKREPMGRTASLYADWTIITDDNPRREDPKEICRMIHKGCPQGLIIRNRVQAISHSISLLEAGDILLIAGKGHESHQISAQGTVALSDKQIVSSILVPSLKK